MQPLKIKIEEGNEPKLILPKVILEIIGANSGSEGAIQLEQIRVTDSIQKNNAYESIGLAYPTVNKPPVSEALKMPEGRHLAAALDDEIFSALLENVLELDSRITIKTVGTSMIGCYHRRRGLVWVKYPQGDNITLHLRKGDYSSVDRNRRVKYSRKNRMSFYDSLNAEQIVSSTFGDYPTFTLAGMDDIEYAIVLIRCALMLK